MPGVAETLIALPRSLGLRRAFWRDVARRWTGLGLLHLHLAVGLALIPVTARVQQTFSAFARDTAPALFAEFPKILVHDGQVRAPDAATWIDPRDDRVLLVVDTAARRAPSPGEPMLLTKQALWLQAPGLPPRRLSLDGLTLLIDAETMMGWVNSLRIGLSPLFYASVFVASACWRLGLAFFALGPAAYGFSRLRGRGLGLGACVRIAAFAQTPGLAIGALGLSFGDAPLLWLVIASLVPVIWTAWAIESG